MREPDSKELEILQKVYKTLTQPVYDAMMSHEHNSLEGLIAQRVLLGIATLVEASRDKLVKIGLNGDEKKTVTTFVDLMEYLPDPVVMDTRFRALLTARLKGSTPSAMMGSLGWSIRSDNALDGKIREGFSDQQYYELQKIHQLK